MAEIWLFCHSYKIITIDDFNRVGIDENGDDDDSERYFYIIDDKICQKKCRTKKIVRQKVHLKELKTANFGLFTR